VLEWLATSDERRQQVEPEKDFTVSGDPLITYSYYGDPKEELLCGSRFGSDPDFRLDVQGFRVLQSLRSSSS